MSATNKTTNYNLPLFVGSDVPSWLGDWNSAMTSIDAAIFQAANSGGGGGGSTVSIVQTTGTSTTSVMSQNACTQAFATPASVDAAITASVNSTGPGSVGDLITSTVATQVNSAVAGKQDTLVSGTNIKTINGQSILGSGDLPISGGGGGGTGSGSQIASISSSNATTQTNITSISSLSGYVFQVGNAVFIQCAGALNVNPSQGSITLEITINEMPNLSTLYSVPGYSSWSIGSGSNTVDISEPQYLYTRVSNHKILQLYADTNYSTSATTGTFNFSFSGIIGFTA